MERPTIEDPDILHYVESLEAQIANYTSEGALVILYLGLKKQVLEIGQFFLKEHKTADGKVFNLLDMDALQNKDDKLFDRMFKVWEKSKLLAESMVYLEGSVNPEKLKNAEKVIEAAGGVEAYVQKMQDGES